MAILACGLAGIYSLQMLHLLPFQAPLGPLKFFDYDLWGALLWLFVALLWFWLAIYLLRLDPNTRFFLFIHATVSLVLAILSGLGGSSWVAMLPIMLLSGLMLLYAYLMSDRKFTFYSSSTGFT